MQNDKCCVCDKVLDINVCSTKCDHLFHYGCIDFWLKKNQTCPQCDKSATLFDIQVVDVVNTVSEIEDEESKSTPNYTQNKYGKGEGSHIYAKDSGLIVDNSGRRGRGNQSEQGPSRLPNLNIYNHTGTVIVCDTYEPKTANFFGFGKSSSSTPQLENEPQKKGWLESAWSLLRGKETSNQLEYKKQDGREDPEVPNVSSTKRSNNNKGTINQFENKKQYEREAPEAPSVGINNRGTSNQQESGEKTEFGDHQLS